MPKSLPPRPSLVQLQNQAKNLLKAHRQADQEACTRIQEFLPRLSQSNLVEISSSRVSLQEVQHVISREYGFGNWVKLCAYVREVTIAPDMANLISAIEIDDEASAQSIVQRNPKLMSSSIEFPSVDGERTVTNTPLSYAAQLRVTEPMSRVIKVLVSADADVRRSADSGMTSAERLQEAIEINSLEIVRFLLESEPDLADATLQVRLGGKNSSTIRQRAIVYAANQRRTEILALLLSAGASEQLDFALERASLFDDGLPIMQLLVDHGVKLKEDSLMGPCECLAPEAIKFCLANGADLNFRKEDSGETALDLAITTYTMSDTRQGCIEALIQGGAKYAEEDGAAYDILRGRMDLVEERYKNDPDIVHHRFDLETKRKLGQRATYGGHHGGANLKNTTLLHVCAQFNFLKEAEWLIEHGADVNARAVPDENGYGNQTPIFHAVTSNWNYCSPMVAFLADQGADLNIRSTIKFPVGDRTVFRNVTPLGYTKAFQNDRNHEPNQDVLELLMARGGVE